MAKLKNPLISLRASGKLNKTLSFLRRKSVDIVEKSPYPKDAKTSAQLSWRTMYQLAVALWHELSAEEKRIWEAAGTTRHMTGYAWFISQALRPNPGIYLPLAGGAMQGNIAMGFHAITGLPDPAAAQDADTLNARSAAIAAHAAIAAAHHARFTAGEAVAAAKTVKLNEFTNPDGSVEFNQKQALQLVIENLTEDPGSPVEGQIWLRTDVIYDWVSPTGFIDGGAWANEPLVYDGDLGTMATEAVPLQSWSSWLELTHEAFNCIGVRLYADKSTDASLNRVNIDVWYGDNWHTIVENELFTALEWNEYEFPVQSITKARVAFWNSSGATTKDAHFREFDFEAQVTGAPLRIYHHAQIYGVPLTPIS